MINDVTGTERKSKKKNKKKLSSKTWDPTDAKSFFLCRGRNLFMNSPVATACFIF